MRNPILIRILGNADGSRCLIAGLFIKDFDPDAFDGRGDVEVTADVAIAKQFPDFDAAVRYWKQASRIAPVRRDGKPNRPLTAYTVDIGPAHDRDPWRFEI